MSDRFASISSLLPARPPAQTDDVAQPSPRGARAGEGASPADVVRSATPRSRPPRRPREQPRPPASDSTDGGTRRTAFRLDPDLHQQLTDRALRTKTSKGNVVLDAIEDAHAAGALELKKAEPTKTAMFIRTADRAAAAPTVLVEIRLTAQALHQVDQLVQTTGQPTRTSLLHAALAYYFSGVNGR